MTQRTRNTPSTASNFHMSLRKSCASGYDGNPSSALQKMRYDLGLWANDMSRTSRVVAVFVDGLKEELTLVRDPLELARKCELRAVENKKANGRTTQMLHIDLALPTGLDHDTLMQLSSNINAVISEILKSPSWGCVHMDDGNPHLHASIPVYQIVRKNKDTYVLGGRIPHMLPKAERQKLNLPSDRRTDWNNLRMVIAYLISKYLWESYARTKTLSPEVFHLCDRWRCGYKKLYQQVLDAKNRGDIDFVLENAGRAPTKKRGPNGKVAAANANRYVCADDVTNLQSSAVSQESMIQQVDHRMVTKAGVINALKNAQQTGLTSPESIRRHLLDNYGLTMDFVGTVGKPAIGVIFGFSGDPIKYAGSKLELSLWKLKKLFNWSESPKVMIPEGVPAARENSGMNFFARAVQFANTWSRIDLNTAFSRGELLWEKFSSLLEEHRNSISWEKFHQEVNDLFKNADESQQSNPQRHTSRPKN